MVGNVFVQRLVALFTRALAEADLHYRSHLCCHCPQRSMESFTIDIGNARENQKDCITKGTYMEMNWTCWMLTNLHHDLSEF
ncbi:hypothetical protein TNCV_3824921 [Trichonephila clavipes]|nr:hypothetical protein TNCV_3824921 [Trichonephila clavipes]